MVTTLADLIVNTVKAYPKPDFMLFKKEGAFTPISTGEFGDGVKHLALGLNALGFEARQKLCLLSENRPAWTMTDLATLCAGGLTVPIYTTLVPEQIRYIIDDSDATVVVVSNADHWKKIEPLRGGLGKVKHYITFADKAPAGVLTLKEVMDKGRAVAGSKPGLFDELVARSKPGDEATLIYTSGTTGMPKGVILTHDNIVSNVKTATAIIEFTDKDTVLSFLPLSHILERTVMFAFIYKGCTIAFAESVEAVAKNLLEVRPHIMVSVPRVFEKIYTKVMDQVLSSPSLRRKIFFWALKVGKAYGAAKLAGKPVSGGLRFRRSVAAKLVFSKIIAKTGGRVRFFVSGGAPLSKDIAEFFYALGLVILEGYGLTETAPMLSINTFEHIRLGTVGKPVPGVDIKIAADGEILARGPNVMKGYYKKEAETREVLEGGWFHTGDIGRIRRRTASWSSPTGRRTSSSPRAARTSPPSPSRTCSKRAPTSRAAWSSETGSASSRRSSCPILKSSRNTPGRRGSPSPRSTTSAGTAASSVSSRPRSTGRRRSWRPMRGSRRSPSCRVISRSRRARSRPRSRSGGRTSRPNTRL